MGKSFKKIPFKVVISPWNEKMNKAYPSIGCTSLNPKHPVWFLSTLLFLCHLPESLRIIYDNTRQPWEWTPSSTQHVIDSFSCACFPVRLCREEVYPFSLPSGLRLHSAPCKYVVCDVRSLPPAFWSSEMLCKICVLEGCKEEIDADKQEQLM